MRAPIGAGATAWLGADLRRDPSRWTGVLSADEVAAIVEPTPPDRLAQVLAPQIASLRTELTSGRGFALVRGLPVDELGPDRAADAFVRFGGLLGSARRQNAAGDLLGHVRDTGRRSTDPSVRIYQTNERQTFHTDSTDVVALLCLRNAPEGGDSLLVSAATIHAEMWARDPELAELLFEPIATDRRGEVPPGESPFFTIPVLSWYDDALTVMYQRQYIESAQRFPDAPRLEERTIAALDLFDEIANDPDVHLRMRLEPGDVQFVHNHSLLHDRTAFRDDPAAPRHLLRLWLSVAGDRRLPPVFASRFGSTTVGDRGGIVVA